MPEFTGLDGTGALGHLERHQGIRDWPPLARQAAAQKLVIAGPAIEMAPGEGEDLGTP
jgi:hypothetical protein